MLDRGADLRWNNPVREWRATHAGVEVRTDRDIYSAKQLVDNRRPLGNDAAR